MSDHFEYLDAEDIISLDSGRFQQVIGHNTFKTIEFLAAVAAYISEDVGVNEAWVYDGIDCRVLSAGKYWRPGRVRLSLEFIPDEPGYPIEPSRQIAAGLEPEY